MPGSSWKDDIKKYFENARIIEKAKAETLESFEQFCEFIAEPAFEAFEEELKNYRVKGVIKKDKGRFIQLRLSFPGAKTDNFHYRIVLPKNSFELRLVLVIKGRRNKKAILEEKEEDFLNGLEPSKVMKIAKEDLIQDVIRHLRDYNFTAMTSCSG